MNSIIQLKQKNKREIIVRFTVTIFIFIFLQATGKFRARRYLVRRISEMATLAGWSLLVICRAQDRNLTQQIKRVKFKGVSFAEQTNTK